MHMHVCSSTHDRLLYISLFVGYRCLFENIEVEELEEERELIENLQSYDVYSQY